MTSRLQRELRQNKPWASVGEEALVSIARTAALFEHAMAEAMRPYRITPTQYNVLRILRGAGAEGLCRNSLRDRLVAPVPDATRLLDRMAEMELVTRDRDGADRRFVTTRITEKGLKMLTTLEEPLGRVQKRLLAHVPTTKLEQLVELLADVREGSGASRE